MQITNDQLFLLEQRINNLEVRLNAAGISTEIWLSPEKAGPFVGCKKDKILGEIYRAERARNNGETPDLKLGVHYYDMATPNSFKSRWRIDPNKFREVLQTPREQRPVYSWEAK